MNQHATDNPIVREFAAAVRARLNDLPADEVDELTEGLEADLAERLDDRGADRGADPEADRGADHGDDLGDPDAYADELRAAAGLAPRQMNARHEKLAARIHRHRREVTEAIRASRGGSQALDFFIALRPVWWLLRAWVIYAGVGVVFGWNAVPSGFTSWLVFALILVLSVQWGRGRWLAWPWLPPVKVAVSVVAAIAIVPLVSTTASTAHGYTNDDAYLPEPMLEGLVLGGSEVSNIFPFDCAGEPLTDIQLFDQNGAPLSVATGDVDYLSAFTQRGDNYEDLLVLPNPNVSGRTGWNVFPLAVVEGDGYDENGELDLSKERDATAPFAGVQPLADAAGACGSAGAGDGAGAGGAGEESGAAVPGGAAAPSAAPTPGAPTQQTQGAGR